VSLDQVLGHSRRQQIACAPILTVGAESDRRSTRRYRRVTLRAENRTLVIHTT
jgi:hypothetical protein